VTLPLMWWHGLIGADAVVGVVAGLPVAVLGVWLGGRHFFGTDPQDFRRFAIGLLAVLACMGLAKAVL
jgi:hypothetical protein